MNNYVYEYEPRYQYLTSICLNMTDACNLRCRYCFVNQHPNYMTLDTAKAAVDWLVNNLKIKKENNWASQDEKCHLTFFGGEPMLLFETVIQPLILYIEDKYPNDFRNFDMTTNGTLLSKEKIAWMKEHRLYFMTSIDGNKETQDFNRPCADENQSSFDLVKENIPYILEYEPNITFRSTIAKETVQNTFENYVFAECAGFRSIYMMPNGRELWDDDILNILAEETTKIFQYRKDQYLRGIQPITASFIDKIFADVKRTMRMIVNHDNFEHNNGILNVNRCGLATTNGSIGYDGTIYGCQEQDSRTETNSLFVIGNIFNGGIDPELHNKLLATYAYQGAAKCSSREYCYNCNLRHLCDGSIICPSSSWDCFGDMSTKSHTLCYWNNLLYQLALDTTVYLYSQNNKLFIDYFNNL